ncbi:MAG TPA: agmatine deiminase family protein [Polyangiaceae bacterium]|nr:agmatine deiminase family protein [Polyangiaceae bacterium]
MAKKKVVSEESTPAALGFRMPAEWEPHRATWLSWPHEQSDWPGKFGAVPWVFCEIAKALQEGERIRLIVKSAADERTARAALKSSGVSLATVDFHRFDTDRSWTRDSVPTFVTRPAEGRKKRGALAAVNWRFNGWARYKNHKKDDALGPEIAATLGLPRFDPILTLGRKSHRFVLEGGAIDVDGQGTLLATEECLLDGKQARNPELGRALSEEVLRDYLGAEKVIWLGRGIVGDDTGGHVDDFARFVAPGKVVIAVETNRKDPNFRLLGEARERLNGARDARGRKLEVIPLPMPAPIVFDGQRLPASYANFFVGNAAVLVPTFNDVNDRIALGILTELFGDRPVKGIHSTDFVLGLGTIHCSTQQEPAFGGSA